ncbi:Putative carbon-nitrogen hydrolase, nitrilase/Cyanide hydratase [Colletotrichum destructivum]|uniref:nitrilase n=1 Tax=Colletotrichum destructivum TaxID=34406 RepID=A0AAX4IQW7_9PEZI|nr:Putative carbon-nitrogen hydrolase, nitrilase/Cyanide hydratase [Colletotrichum destructivum]
MAARTFDKSNITLSAVVAAPAGWPLPVGNKNWTDGHFDLKATVEYGTKLIAEARGNGADLVAFPELWFPGYPKSLEAKWMFPLVEEYVANSLVVDSDEWKALRDAARENAIYVSFGFSERAGDFIYMSQALLGPEGEVLINRRKLRPSGTERGLWSDGSDDGLMVVDTKIGRVGMLQCWEHLRPTMTFNIQAQLPNIHVGAWPYNQNPGTADVENWEDVDVAYSALRLMSILTNAVTVTPSIGYGFINQFTTLLAHSNSNTTAHPNDDQDYAPLIYSSVNGSSWSNQSYDIDGEVSWGTLKQIEDGFPEYIPKVCSPLLTLSTYPTTGEPLTTSSPGERQLRRFQTTVEPPSTSVATGTLLVTATSVPTGTISSGAASAGMPAAAPAVLQLAAALVTVVCYLW